MGSAKTRRLEMAITAIQQKWGLRALRKLDPPAGVVTVPRISTGFPQLDEALEIGGLARGRISELAGPATSGKTTLALKFLVEAQMNRGRVGYVDHARFFDPDYAYRCGLDLSRLIVVAPYDLQEALSITEALIKSKGLAALVFDGLDLGSDAASMQLLSACLGRIVAPLADSDMAMLFLHEPITQPSSGLSALAHYANARLDITRESWLRPHGELKGYKASVTILKNRQGPAGRKVTINIVFNGTVRSGGLGG